MSGQPTQLIAITCAECGATFKVSAKHVGKKGRCPIENCGAAYVVQEPHPVHRARQPSIRTESTVRRASSDDLDALPLRRAASPTAKKARTTKRPARGIARRLWPLWSAAGFGSIVMISIVIWGTGAIEPKQLAAAKPDTYQQQIAPFVKKYCVECHGAENAEGGIALHSFDSEASVLKGRKHWEKVLPMLQIEAMPPVEDGRARPTHDEFLAVTAWLDDKLFNIDCKINRDPGRVTVRRLNRVEYNNTIRDLLGIDFSPADDFPSDDVGYGFDNIGDVLSVSPLLMEKYLDAAEKISEKTINSADPTKAKKLRFAGKGRRSRQR